MSDNENRILVLEADKSNLNQFIFDLSWEHLDKIKGNQISRAEAVERMAKGLCSWEQDCIDCQCGVNTNACRLILSDEGYIARAEAALDALLGKEAENGGGLRPEVKSRGLPADGRFLIIRPFTNL